MKLCKTIPAGMPASDVNPPARDLAEASTVGEDATQPAPAGSFPADDVGGPPKRPMRRGRKPKAIEQPEGAAPQFFSLEQLAASIGVNRRWVWDRCKPRGPLPVYIFSATVVRVDIRDWQKFCREFVVQ
jgi:hypothetical protein